MYLSTYQAYIDVPAYPPTAPPVQTPPSPEWSSVALFATVKAERFLTELGAQVEMQEELIHDHIVRLGELSPALFERYDRVIGELFTRSEMENQELRLQIVEERRARLDLAEIVASMRRGQEPRGDV
nr:hypothetical protein [Tanacetum cinerariifolium]